jgi:N-acetyl-anhydromuramyl-L-alanine amidase AmpD
LRLWPLIGLGAAGGYLAYRGILGRKAPSSLEEIDLSFAPAHAAMDPRRELPKWIVLHTMEGSDGGSDEDKINQWVELATGDRNVLTHILLRQSGRIILLVPPINFQTWHARSWNALGVGIDLSIRIGDGNPRGGDGSAMPAPMMASLKRLLGARELCNLPILGHGTHLDPANRHDPGKDFPWPYLGCDRVVRCSSDCWDRKCVSTKEEALQVYSTLQGRRSTYSIRDIALDASAAFVGVENAGVL